MLLERVVPSLNNTEVVALYAAFCFHRHRTSTYDSEGRSVSIWLIVSDCALRVVVCRSFRTCLCPVYPRSASVDHDFAINITDFDMSVDLAFVPCTL